jgi:hypothetical protein
MIHFNVNDVCLQTYLCGSKEGAVSAPFHFLLTLSLQLASSFCSLCIPLAVQNLYSVIHGTKCSPYVQNLFFLDEL